MVPKTKSFDALLEKRFTKEEIAEIDRRAALKAAQIRAEYKRKVKRAYALKKRRVHPLRRKKHE